MSMSIVVNHNMQVGAESLTKETKLHNLRQHNRTGFSAFVNANVACLPMVT